MGRMTAFPSKKQAEEKVVAVDGRCLIMRQVIESLPHRIQRVVRRRVRCQRTRVQRRHKSMKLLVHRHPNHLQHHVYPWGQNVLAPRYCRHQHVKLPTEIAKRRPSVHSKLYNLVGPSPVSARSKCFVNRRIRRVKASGPVTPLLKARDTCTNKSPIRVVVLAVVGLSGVIARPNAFVRGRFQRGTGG